MKSGDSDDIWKSDDSPPEGWTVEVKVRASGRKDKVTLEKSKPESLPPGWTKEIKVKKKGNKIRRDPYYTDPVSGYVFRSMKDAFRYLETRDLGRLAFKSKEKSSDNVNLEDDKDSSPAAAKKQKLALEKRMSPIISNQSSKLFEVVKDKNVFSPAHIGESMPVPEFISDHREIGTQSNSSTVQEDKDFNQKIGKNEPGSVTATADGALSNEHSQEKETITDETKGTGKSKKKKNLNLPRRASKRLAGLPLDPTPELKTTNCTRQAAFKQSTEEASTGRDSTHAELESEHAFDTSKNTKWSVESNKSKHPTGSLAALHDHLAKAETERRGSEKPEYASTSPLGNMVEWENKGSGKHGNATVSEHAGKIQTENTDDEKLQQELDLPLEELWQDPCIAFAIKTLTGISFDSTDSVQASSGSNNSEFGGLATLEDRGRKEDAQNVIQPLKNVGTRERDTELEISNKDDGKPGSPLNLSFADAWADPCIEFAIKTLTGAIPLDYGVVIQDCHQQNASSSQSQDSSGLTWQNAGESGQSQLLCQQFSIQERPLYHQEVLMEPALGHSKNVNVGYSDGTIHPQHREERN